MEITFVIDFIRNLIDFITYLMDVQKWYRMISDVRFLKTKFNLFLKVNILKQGIRG